MAIHKGSELNNVRETWNQNEQNREGDNTGSSEGTIGVSSDLQQTIKEEAAEYDNTNKEAQLLVGERATVRDNKSNED